jgi:hypothetical protein
VCRFVSVEGWIRYNNGLLPAGEFLESAEFKCDRRTAYGGKVSYSNTLCDFVVRGLVGLGVWGGRVLGLPMILPKIVTPQTGAVSMLLENPMQTAGGSPSERH